jgi:hypothetical protein
MSCVAGRVPQIMSAARANSAPFADARRAFETNRHPTLLQ